MPALYLFSGGALFIGAVSDNEIHRHHAVQLVVSPQEFELEVPEHSNKILRTRAALVAANVPHRLDGPHAGQYFVMLDEESQLVQTLSHRLNGGLYVPAAPIELQETEEPSSCDRAYACVLSIVRSFSGEESASSAQVRGEIQKDERVEHALRLIGTSEDFRISLAELAQAVGLSESRLVHLFKEQVGLPLRRYALWLRVRRAVAAAGRGVSLTEAAHEAGFADQAHFIRSFRDMFGLAPGEVLVRRGAVKIQICESDI